MISRDYAKVCAKALPGRWSALRPGEVIVKERLDSCRKVAVR